MSNDASYVYAVMFNGNIYKFSNDFWDITTAPRARWYGITTSGSGQYVYATQNGGTGNIYKSSDYGTTWGKTAAPGYQNWYGIVTSDNGQIVYAVVKLGDIYKSFDYGATWAPLGAAHSNWHSIATTRDGQSIAAAASGGSIHTAQAYSPSGTCDIFCNAKIIIHTFLYCLRYVIIIIAVAVAFDSRVNIGARLRGYYDELTDVSVI